MSGQGGSVFSLVVVLLLSNPATSDAAEEAVCSIVRNPQDFDHKRLVVKGAPLNVKQTTSQRGNDYTTFKLRDAAGCVVTIFAWGHPSVSCDSLVVEGVFETEHHQGRYTFYNEIQAEKVNCIPR
jgi:hypothetical protein